MSPFAKAFVSPAFIGYLTGGDGGIQYSIEAFLALIEGGVNILEIGIPFSDPVADGPVIQLAMKRALNAGTTPESILRIAEGIRLRSSVPLLAFSYYNPLLQAGADYLLRLKQAGFDGVLTVDLPIEEADDHGRMMGEAGLETIWVATPATPKIRLGKMAEKSKGFIYYACQKGTTGFRNSLPSDFGAKIKSIKEETGIPVAVGFGIKDRATAQEVVEHADGFVVGSLFVDAIASGAAPEKLCHLAKSLIN